MAMSPTRVTWPAASLSPTIRPSARCWSDWGKSVSILQHRGGGGFAGMRNEELGMMNDSARMVLRRHSSFIFPNSALFSRG